jgi:hypothetical protein
MQHVIHGLLSLATPDVVFYVPLTQFFFLCAVCGGGLSVVPEA